MAAAGTDAERQQRARDHDRQIAERRNRTRTRVDDLGQLVEIPPRTLDCGHPYGPGLVTIGYQPHPAGDRARSYYCRACSVVTFDR